MSRVCPLPWRSGVITVWCAASTRFAAADLIVAAHVVSRECRDAGTEVDQNGTVQHHERFTGTLSS